MFSNGISSFVMFNIYSLLGINILLLILLYFLIIKNKIYNKLYIKKYNELKPLVFSYIHGNRTSFNLREKAMRNFDMEIAMDIIFEYSSENDIDLAFVFEELGYDDMLIKRANKKINLALIKRLALMKSMKAFNVLLKSAESNDFEISYMSFYALSLLKLNEDEIHKVVKRLMDFQVPRDRMIEILENFNLQCREYVDILETQQTEIGKVVLLKVIQSKINGLLKEDIDKIVKYLNSSKEVRIAACSAIAAAKNEEYLQLLLQLYDYEKEWEVRAAIAKGLRNFPIERVKEYLKRMTYDKAWWVRFNAFESIVFFGILGVDILIDISLDNKNKNVSDLAYYFLNANQNVYKAINGIEG